MAHAACLSGAEGDAALAAAACRDRREFVALYDRYVERIDRYVRARTQSTSEVDDLVSATFMRALSNLHTFRAGRGAFAAWLFTIARNVVRDHERGRRHYADVPPPERADPTAELEAVTLRGEQAREVRAALQRLNEVQREALALRYAGELSFVEVATAMGKSEAAAKMLVQRGLQALRRQLEEECT